MCDCNKNHPGIQCSEKDCHCHDEFTQKELIAIHENFVRSIVELKKKLDSL